MWVVIAKIGAPFGVQGALKVHSFTNPPTNLEHYSNIPWQVGDELTLHVKDIRIHQNAFVATFEEIDSIEIAQTYVNKEVKIERKILPELPKGEYYWADLEGLSVFTTDDKPLGVISHLFETGANDVLVVIGERQRLIPFIKEQVIKSVDLESKRVTVDWDPDF